MDITIGILCIDISTKLRDLHRNKQYQSYIYKSYVKFLAASGGKFVPILIGKDEDYYRNEVNVDAQTFVMIFEVEEEISVIVWHLCPKKS
uniref:Uncharacterized protein n=1 Tax=Megaselia scalaris TaxID=36166 RepID=T1GAR7_MEGSC